MIRIRYKKILFAQTLFLIILSIAAHKLAQHGQSFNFYIGFWSIAILIDLLFIIFFALPSRSLVKKLNTNSFFEDYTWSEIEETINQKNLDFIKQTEYFESENLKYKLLLDSLEDPVCILNKELKIFYANHTFRHFFQIEDKNLPIPLIEITRNLEFKNFLTNAIEKNMTSRKSYFSFNQLQDPSKKYFDLKLFPIEHLNNYLCLLHDVTERKLADLIREDFVSNFSHEVRTPLTILNGQIQSLQELLKNETELKNQYHCIFEKINNNSRRLISLFNDLLVLNSIETKKEINKEIVNIEEMITYLPQELLINYPGKKIDFNFDFKQKNFFIDYNLFEQIIINLLDNSIKYSRLNGLVKIQTYNENHNDYLIISDNGIGIPENQLHRIFERFFRVDASRSSEISGTGLGLSIVKHIVQKHGGKIKVKSVEDSGTTFTIALPSSLTNKL